MHFGCPKLFYCPKIVRSFKRPFFFKVFHIVGNGEHQSAVFFSDIGEVCTLATCFNRSGVFAGVLVSEEGQKVVLKDCRRLWYWNGAASISQIAKDGVSRASSCKFTVTVEQIAILDAIEIIPTTAAAEANIKAVREWKM